MSISEDNERFTFVIDKNLKKKLQMLGEHENRKLGNYIAHLLEKHIIDYEEAMINEESGELDLHMFHLIFGSEAKPQIETMKGKVTNLSSLKRN